MKLLEMETDRQFIDRGSFKVEGVSFTAITPHCTRLSVCMQVSLCAVDKMT